MLLLSGKSQVLCSVWKLKSSCSHLINLLRNYLYGSTAATALYIDIHDSLEGLLKQYFNLRKCGW